MKTKLFTSFFFSLFIVNCLSAQWIQQSSGTSNNIYAAHFISATTGWVVGGTSGVGQPPVILKTTNGGTSWVSQNPPILSDDYLYSVYFTSASAGWAVGNEGKIIRTSDGGATWLNYPPVTSAALFSVNFPTSTDGWIVGDYGFILHTTNSGTNWTAQVYSGQNYLLCTKFISATTGWVVGSSGLILKTTNGGSTFNQQTSGFNDFLSAVYFTDASVGYAVGNLGKILKTTNGGALWSSLNSGTTDYLYFVNFASSSTGWAVGYNNTILYTTNSGSSWTSQSQPNGQFYYGVQFLNSTTGYAVGQSGIILKTTNGGGQPPPPPAPTNLQATTVSNSQINLTWQDNSSNENYFRIERSADGFSYSLIDSVNANITSYQSTGLTQNTDYYYKVYARMGTVNSGYSNISIAHTLSLGPNLSTPANGSVNQSLRPTLSWASFPGALSYQLQISYGINFSSLAFNDSTLTANSINLPSGILQNGTSHYWRVRAKTASLVTDYSSTWSFSTTAGDATALDFDGINDFVSVPDLAGVNNFSSTLKFTVEFWCKVNSDAGNFVFVNKGGGGGNEQYSIDIDGASLRFYVRTSGSQFVHINAPRITVAESWVHLAAVFDYSNGIMKLYKNGIQIGSASPPSSLHTNTNALAFGAQAFPLNAYLKGKIDEVRIWNYALSQAQIQNKMYCEIPSTSTGLTANYHFNHGESGGTNTGITSLIDASGNSNHGTLTGFALAGSLSNWIGPSGIAKGSYCGPGEALDFDGVNDNITVQDIPGVNNFSSTLKFTVEFWCKVNSDAGDFTFINKGGGGGLEQYSIDIFGSHLRFYVKSAAGAFTHLLVPRITVADGWTHIAATFDYFTSQMRLYKNGIDIGNIAPPSSLNNNSNPLAIGVQANSINQPLNGKMDEVRIWNHLLTQSEIAEDMNCQLPESTDGLVVNYHFNQGEATGLNTGINILADSSGLGNNGTLNGFALSGAASNWVAPGSAASGISCGPASALDFDGVNDYVSAADVQGVNNFSNSLQFTVEFWCKVNSDVGDFTFVNKGGGAGLEQYSIDIFRNDVRYYVKSADGVFIFTTIPRITVKEGWVHLAATFNWANGIMRLYKNGALVSSASPPPSLNSNSNPLTIGVQYNFLNQPLKGRMDEVRIWNYARTQSEIQNNMNCEIPSTKNGLVANYHFNEGLANGINYNATALIDGSSSANHGTLHNFTLDNTISNWVAPGGVVSGTSCASQPSTLDIKVFPEGFYNTSGETLNSSDSITVELHSNVSPYELLETAVDVIDSVTFSGTFTFNQQGGTYYIAARHRNSIETWSRNGGETFIPGSAMNYNFTDALNKALGDNMKQVDAAPVRFAIFSGDVNQDGIVDLTDNQLIDNDANNFLSGYVTTDLTGDNFVDINDGAIADNNGYNFVNVIRP